jgi:hypothetical protein
MKEDVTMRTGVYGLTMGARVDGIVLITAVGHYPVQYRNMFRHILAGK